MLNLGRLLLQEFVDQQGSGDLGPTLEYHGKTLQRLDTPYEKRYVSVFGEIPILRTVFGTRKSQKQEVAPLDTRLNRLAGDFSFLLQDWSQGFCVQGSYQQSREAIERILGIGHSVRSLEHMNGAMAREVEAFRDSQPAPPAGDEGPILLLTADGKGEPMQRETAPEKSPTLERQSKGEKAQKKQMACVGAVYTIALFPRPAEEVVEEVFRRERNADRPRPRHKQMRAELTREIGGEEVNGKDRIFTWFTEARQARHGEGG